MLYINDDVKMTQNVRLWLIIYYTCISIVSGGKLPPPEEVPSVPCAVNSIPFDKGFKLTTVCVV